MRAFGASEASLPLAKDYAFWMFVAALANLPAQSMNCAARAESSVRISSVAVITGAALNVILDPVFMFDWGLNMGVEGASLATTVSQFVTFFILIRFYASGRSVIRIRAKGFRPGWELIKTVVLIGIPTAVIQICLSVASSLTNIAAYGVVQRLILIGCYVVMGFMQGYQPVASLKPLSQPIRRKCHALQNQNEIGRAAASGTGPAVTYRLFSPETGRNTARPGSFRSAGTGGIPR